MEQGRKCITGKSEQLGTQKKEESQGGGRGRTESRHRHSRHRSYRGALFPHWAVAWATSFFGSWKDKRAVEETQRETM